MKEKDFKQRASRLGITEDYLREVMDFFDMGIWIRDVCLDGSTYVFRYGEDEHDDLYIIGGEVHYINLQNGDGCCLRIEPENMMEHGYHLVDWDYLTDEELQQIIEMEKRGRVRELLIKELFQIAARVENINDTERVQKIGDDLRDCAMSIEVAWEE